MGYVEVLARYNECNYVLQTNKENIINSLQTLPSLADSMPLLQRRWLSFVTLKSSPVKIESSRGGLVRRWLSLGCHWEVSGALLIGLLLPRWLAAKLVGGVWCLSLAF